MVNWLWPLWASTVALILALPISYVWSARQSKWSGSNESGLELVVFEADGCIYCDVLRRDVVPLYNASGHGKMAPLRFFNVSRSDETELGLAGAITIAPTVVLLRDGREQGRITGYVGPDAFLSFASLMIGRAD